MFPWLNPIPLSTPVEDEYSETASGWSLTVCVELSLIQAVMVQAPPLIPKLAELYIRFEELEEPEEYAPANFPVIAEHPLFVSVFPFFSFRSSIV